MKKSIALFFTLIFILLAFVIVAKIENVYQKFFNDTFYKDISQNSILIKNITSIIDNFTKDINDSTLFYQNFLITSKDFNLFVQTKPIFDKVNINEINKKEVQTFLDNILEYYQIQDPIFFKALLLDTIDKDKKERVEGSEIILTNQFFKQGKIYNYAHFKEILDYYVKKTEDKNIYSIPWRELIYFSDKKSIIDCNILNKKVAKFLGLVFNDKISCEELESFDENKKIMQNLSIIPYNKKIDYLIKVIIHYSKQTITLIYNINKKRIEDIKTNFLY